MPVDSNRNGGNKLNKIKSKERTISIRESILSNKTFIKKHDQWKPVRVKFRMMDSTFSDLKWLADYFHVSQKELLDDLAGNESLLDDMAKTASKVDDVDRSIFSRKTKVISNGSLNNLKKAADKYGVTRDIIVELLIHMLSKGIKEEIKSMEDVHKSALKVINELWNTIEEYEAKLKKLLGEDDPIVSRMGIIYNVAMNLSAAIESELEDGTPIDPSDYSQSA